MLPNIINALTPKIPRPEDQMPQKPGFFPQADPSVTFPGGGQVQQAPPVEALMGQQMPQQQPATTGFFPGGQQGAETPIDVSMLEQTPVTAPGNTDQQFVNEAARRAEEFKTAQAQPQMASNQMIDSRGNPQPGFFPVANDTPTTETPKIAQTPLENETDPEKFAARAANGEVVSKPKWWKRALKGALVGSLKGMGATGNIGGAIGGAAAGGLVEGFYPKAYQGRETEERVQAGAPLIEAKQKAAEGKAKREKMALELEKLTADTEGVQLSNIEKKINNAYDIVTKSPQWKVAMEAKVITPELAEYFNKAAGVKLTPANWQAIKEDWVNGKPYSRREFSETYNRNTSLPIKPDEVPREIDLGGGALPLTPKSAAPIIAGQVNADAQRRYDAGKTNVSNQIEAQKANNAATTKWFADNLDLRLKAVQAAGGMLGASGEINGIGKELSSIAGQLQRLADRRAKAVDPEEIAKIEKEFNETEQKGSKLQGDFDAALGKVNGGQAVLDQINQVSIPKPGFVSPGTVEPVQIRPGGKTISRAAVQKAAKDNKISYAAAAAQAKAQGYTIQ